MSSSRLLDAMRELRMVASNVLPPLTPVFETLSGVVYEMTEMTEEREDWKRLSEHVLAIAHDLINEMDPPRGTASSPSLKRAIKPQSGDVRQQSDLQNLAKEVVKESNRSSTSRYLDANNKIKDPSDLYRDMEQLLGRLMMNLALGQDRMLSEQTSNTRLKGLKQAEQAKFNSAAASTTHRRACTPGTREQILKKLVEWSNNPDEPPVYWLSGLAGTGKTTIAYSFCQALDAAHQLGASFFCSRLIPKCKDVSFILRTIAYQLARYSHRFQAELCKVLEEEPDAGISGIDVQYELLIHRPLSQIEGIMPSGLVVVIESLDEAMDLEGVKRILDLFFRSANDLPFKLFLTSRPQPVLRDKIDAADDRSIFYLHEIEDSLVKDDIAAYLSDELKEYRITETDIDKLAVISGKLFIHAATVVRYVQQSRGPIRARDRLQTVLGQKSRPGATPFKDLDALYTMILEDVMDNRRLDAGETELVQLVLRVVVCTKEPVAAATLTELLDSISLDEVNLALEPLYSVLYRSNDLGVVATLHSSFAEYMVDRDRSGQFYCNRSEYDALLARGCFDIMKRSLRFNICNLESSFIADKKVSNLASRIDGAIAPHLVYACRYWGIHMDNASAPEDLGEQVEWFLQTQLLHWMEVMNLKGYVSIAVRMLSEALCWVRRSCFGPDLGELAEEGLQFATVFAGNPVSESTPHVYVSARSLMKPQGAMMRHYGKQIHAVLDTFGAAAEWNQTGLLATWHCDGAVGAIACSPDSTRVACGLEHGEVVMRNMLDGQHLWTTPRQHLDSLPAVAFSPDCKRIVTKSGNTAVIVWDVSTQRVLTNLFEGHADSVTSVAFSPDGTRIVSGSYDHTIRIWDAQDGHILVPPFQGHSQQVRSVAFSHDGGRIVSGSYDHTIRIWDADTGRTSAGPFEARSPESVVFSNDSSRIAFGHLYCSVYVRDAETGHILAGPMDGHQRPITSVAFSDDGSRIASGSQDWTVRIWNAYTGEALVSLAQGHTNQVTSVAFSNESSRIVSGSSDGTVCIWDAFAMPALAKGLKETKKVVMAVAVSHDSSRVVSGYSNHTIRVWNTNSGVMAAEPLRGHKRPITSVAFSHDSRYIASSSSDRSIRVWDTLDGHELVGLFKGHTDEVCSVAFSSDSKRIASGSLDGTIRVWDTHTGQMNVEPLEGHMSPVTSVVFSQDGRRIASGSSDQTVRIWDAYTGRSLAFPFEGHSNKVQSVAFSHDHNRIVSGSSDRTIRIWNTATGDTLLGPLTDHTGCVNSVAYSSDSSRIVSGSDDFTVRVWDAETGQAVAVLEGHISSVTSVAFMHNGTHVVSGSEDTAIRIWAIPALAPSQDSRAWTVDSRGWVVSPDQELLTWIPAHARAFLLSPYNIRRIHLSGYLRLNQERDGIGPRWATIINSSS